MKNTLEILVNGKPVKKYFHQNRWFIEAKEGAEYSIRIKNDKHLRQLAVITVDGINVLNGEMGGKSQNGYIVTPYNSITINGFRTSNESVNAFVFSKKSKSYVAKVDGKGNTSNCGVIGVEIFSEKIYNGLNNYPWNIYVNPIPNDYNFPPNIWPKSPSTAPSKPRDIIYKSSDNTLMLRCFNFNNSADGSVPSADFQACSTSNLVSAQNTSTIDFDLGTEFSRKEIKDKVTEIPFETGELEGTFELFYASRSNLTEMGIVFEKENHISFPEAFPAKFCKKPF